MKSACCNTVIDFIDENPETLHISWAPKTKNHLKVMGVKFYCSKCKKPVNISRGENIVE